ncbi:hypothetical protein GCM10007874_29740 [Labrys miyagiensis]|uniref:BioF2-like acetyltransferase domain-containing protein n=1 Tax=Labrys miyagiensis TaxID=346912 RepID=A0ABQ6CK00_9HYPH|nr:GNAT family N-acetyltransferase [Labrys miyagiensis]GLS19957.1 hypothetical protein GCM10007874_29740 [Labrys miyagiensis]
MASFDPLVPTIFHEPWWLSAATKGRAEVVEVTEGGRTVGRLPYVMESRLGLHSSNMPTLTHFLGPGINDGAGSEPNRFVKRQSITRDLIQKLPQLSSFRQKMHRGVKDVLAFQAEDFQVTVQFTFEVQPAAHDVLWKGMRDKTRNVIRRAEESHRVSSAMAPEAFFRFYATNLKAKGENANIDFATCEDVARKALDRGRGHFWAAMDEKGTPKAAVFCVWDAKLYYYMLSTRAPDSGNGAIPLLIWNAMKSAASMGLVFDFDGVANAGSILLYSGFGGMTSPRYIVMKSSAFYKTLREIRRVNPDLSNRFV